MTAIIIVSLLFLLGLSLGIFIFWYVLHRQQAVGKKPANKTVTGLTFRWKYILLPVAILFLAIILAASFYNFLPAEIAYRFNLDGSPKNWLGREMVILLLVVPQLLLTLIALAITWGTAKLIRSAGQIESTLKSVRVLLLMGNMLALPQLVLCFVMIDIFSYNAYGMHLVPVWLFALIVMALGGIIMAIFFIRATKPSASFSKEPPNKNFKE